MDERKYDSKIVSLEEYRRRKEALKPGQADIAESEPEEEPETHEASVPVPAETGVAWR